MTFRIGNLYYDIEYERFSLHTHTNNQNETDSSFLPVINIFTDLPRIGYCVILMKNGKEVGGFE